MLTFFTRPVKKKSDRLMWWKNVINVIAVSIILCWTSYPAGKDKIVEVLPFAPTPPPPQLSEAELLKARQDEENTMRELRIFLRDVTSKLLQDRRFKEFTKPVDLMEVRESL